MPLYEYWCSHCKRRFDIYLAAFNSAVPPCPRCGRSGLERRFSTFTTVRTSKALYEGILNDQQLVQGMQRNDPRALAEWNKRMSGGEKVAPEYEETVERLEHGEMPGKPVGEDLTESKEKTA